MHVLETLLQSLNSFKRLVIVAVGVIVAPELEKLHSKLRAD